MYCVKSTVKFIVALRMKTARMHFFDRQAARDAAFRKNNGPPGRMGRGGRERNGQGRKRDRQADHCRGGYRHYILGRAAAG